MNIYRQELRFQTRSIVIWTLSVLAALALFMGLFPDFAREADLLQETLSTFPEALLASIGMDINHIFEASGFVSYIYGFIQLFLAVMAALYGFRLMNREKISRMNDFLFVKPATRYQVFAQKFLVSVTAFLIINGAIAIIFHFMAALWAIDGPNLATIDEVILGGLLLQFFMFATATLWGVVSKRIKNPVGAATALSFGFFLLLLLGRLMDNDLVKKLSPFGYVEPLEISLKGLSTLTILAFIALTFLLLGLSAFILSRQDLEV